MIQADSKNEQGLTLVEVLAALVILGILFIGIMTIFPQMTAFNAKTETKLDTMNLARQEMEKVTSAEQWIVQQDPANPDDLATFEETVELILPTHDYTIVSEEPGFHRYEKIQDYRYETDIYMECEPYSDESSDTPPCEEAGQVRLYKVHLKIFNDSNLSSETYSYIPFKVEEAGE